MAQKIIVSTSPWKDYKNNKWMVSASINIQLEATGNSTLSNFPDILKWMERLSKTVFFVQFSNAKAKEIKPLTDKWNPALYAKLFHGAIKVDGFQPLDITAIKLKSYPSLHVTNFIFDTYREVGNLKPDTLPDTNFFTKEWSKLDTISQVQLTQTQPLTSRKNDVTVNDFIKKGHLGTLAVKNNLSQNKYIPFSPQSNSNIDFGQFHNFHEKMESAQKRVPTAIKQPEFEYHDILSIITSYPVILRKLGLVIDFELSGAPPSSNGTVRIIASNLNFANDVQVTNPATAYQATGKGFYVSAKPGSFIDKGMLKVNSTDFSVVQIDTDSAALKLANQADAVKLSVASNLVQASNYLQFIDIGSGKKPGEKKQPQPKDEISEEGLPTLRSAGIGLVKNGLAENLFMKFSRNIELHKSITNLTAAVNNKALLNQNVTLQSRDLSRKEIKKNNKASNKVKSLVKDTDFIAANIPQATEILYADDLVMGYRMDVAYESDPGKWYSLHKRKNTYAFVPAGGGKEENIALNKEEELDEGCIHLALTRDEESAEKEDKISEVLARWEGWSLSVPRPGKAIDTEGVGLNTDEEEKKKYKLNDEVPFRLQVNTKPAPRTLPLLRFGKTYRVRLRTVDIAGNGLPVDAPIENEAVAVKPGIKYLRYEPIPVPVLVQGDEVVKGDKSNMRDRDGESVEQMVIRSNINSNTEAYEKNNPTTIYAGNGTDPNGPKNIAVTAITYLHEAVRHVMAPRCSQHMSEVHGMFDEAMKDAGKAAEAYSFITSRDIAGKEDNKVKADIKPVTDTNIPITYLADPMAAGVVLTMHTDTTFETSWKKGESRRFSFYFNDEVSDANADTAVTNEQWKNSKSFRIKLVEGSAAPAWDKSKRMFIIALPKSAQVEIKYASFWRPSDIDKFSGIQPIISRGSNAPRATQFAKRGTHWMFSPWRTIRLVHAVQQPLENPAIDKKKTVAQRNYEDSFASIVTEIKVHGSSVDKIDMEANWKEWVDDLSNLSPGQINNSAHVDTIPVQYKDQLLSLTNPAGIAGQEGANAPFRHVFGDTKHRLVNYKPVATTRYREYFTGIIETAKNNNKEIVLTAAGEEVQLNILSSARPVVPVVDYVLPSFNWLSTKAGKIESHLRTGNIRVYLKRPWYSSGDDEKIAVILPSKAGMHPEIMKKYCTVWGKDPVYAPADLNNSNYPQQEHFPNAAAYKKLGFDNFPLAAEYDTVHLAEEMGTVSIAAFKVLFDTEKQLHYADIPVYIAFAYFPFIRLSLARYQKNALRLNGTDCCLSNIVQTDWIQVAPTRATSLIPVKGASSPGTFDVLLTGTAPFVPGSNTLNGLPAENSTGLRISITVENTLFPKIEEAFITMNNRVQGFTTTQKIMQFDVKREQIKNGQIEFSGRIEANVIPPYRVVIREYELHEFDPIRASADAKARAMNTGMVNAADARDYRERMVFMDVYEIG
jgi:hypothetical protein